MKTTIFIALLSSSIAAAAITAPIPTTNPHPIPLANTTSDLKTYQGYVTTKDEHNNTTTIRDTCQAESTAEAERILKARYPKGTVYGVAEKK